MNFEAYVESGGMQKAVERSTLAAAARANALDLPVAGSAKTQNLPVSVLPIGKVPVRAHVRQLAHGDAC